MGVIDEGLMDDTPNTGRRWWRRGLVVLILIAGVLALRFTVFAPEPVTVEQVEVERGRVESTVTNSKAGTVETRRRAELSPEISGRVAALPFREGDPVAAGDVVMRLDATTQKAQWQQAQRDLETARARHKRACLGAELARREVERNRVLARDEIISAHLLDQLETAADTTAAECDTAAAEIASAEARVAVQANELAKTVLRAPFDGVLAELHVEVGEWTTPSPPAVPVPPALEILDPAAIYIQAPMDEVDSAKIRVGQPARVTLDPYPDRDFAGTVVRVAPYVLDVEAQNRTVEVEVELADGDFAAGLLPGTSADVEVILEVRDDVLRLPTSVLLPGSQVLVVEDGHVARRQVDVGLANWDWTEITGGLEAGDGVISSLDRPEVEPGAPVAPEEEAPTRATGGRG